MNHSRRRRTTGRLAAWVTMTVALVATGAVASSSIAAPGTADPTLTRETLRQAYVPSLCEHPAGELVDGSLPGIGENDGAVTQGTIKIGRVSGQRSAAVVMSCNRGGVGWPDHVLVYRAGEHGPRYVGDIDLGQDSDYNREVVRSVRIRNGKVRLTWFSGNATDSKCCGTVSAEGVVTIRKSERVRLKTTGRHWADDVNRAVVRSVNKGKWKKLRQWMTRSMIANAKLNATDLPWRAEGCYSFEVDITCRISDQTGYRRNWSPDWQGWKSWFDDSDYFFL